jgi:hypothetical protein
VSLHSSKVRRHRSKNQISRVTLAEEVQSLRIKSIGGAELDKPT